MSDLSNRWPLPPVPGLSHFPSLPEHTLLFYSVVPIPTCLASRSSVAGCGMGGFLQVSRFLSRLPPSRIPMHLQDPGHPSPLPRGKALPRPSAPVSVTRQGLQAHMSQRVPSSWKNLLLRIGSGYAAAAGMGVKGGIMAPTVLTEIWLGNRCSSALI